MSGLLGLWIDRYGFGAAFEDGTVGDGVGSEDGLQARERTRIKHPQNVSSSSLVEVSETELHPAPLNCKSYRPAQSLSR